MAMRSFILCALFSVATCINVAPTKASPKAIGSNMRFASTKHKVHSRRAHMLNSLSLKEGDQGTSDADNEDDVCGLGGNANTAWCGVENGLIPAVPHDSWDPSSGGSADAHARYQLDHGYDMGGIEDSYKHFHIECCHGPTDCASWCPNPRWAAVAEGLETSEFTKLNPAEGVWVKYALNPICGIDDETLKATGFMCTPPPSVVMAASCMGFGTVTEYEQNIKDLEQTKQTAALECQASVDAFPAMKEALGYNNYVAGSGAEEFCETEHPRTTECRTVQEGRGTREVCEQVPTEEEGKCLTKIAAYERHVDKTKENCDLKTSSARTWQETQAKINGECGTHLCPNQPELKVACDRHKITWTDTPDEQTGTGAVFKLLPTAHRSDNAGMLREGGADWTLNARITPTAQELNNRVYNLGDNMITVHAIDDYGNTNACLFNVVVLDEQKPVWDCPSDNYVGTITGQCESDANVWDEAMLKKDAATDAQGPVTITRVGDALNTNLEVGSHTQTWTAMDLAGNTEICEFKLVVEDREAPIFQCEEHMENFQQSYPPRPDEDEGGNVKFVDPSMDLIQKAGCLVTDNCLQGLNWDCKTIPKAASPDTPVPNGKTFDKHSPYLKYPLGNTDLDCRAWDSAEKSEDTTVPRANEAFLSPVVRGDRSEPSSGHYIVDIVDDIEPRCKAQENIEVILEDHMHNITVTDRMTEPVVTDNYPGVTWECIFDPSGPLTDRVCKGLELIAGDYEVEYIATDSSGNKNPSKSEIEDKNMEGVEPCTFQISIKDLTAPDWGTSCPSNQTASGEAILEVDTQPLEQYGIPRWTTPIATDASNKVTYNVMYKELVGGAAYPLGFTNIVYIASDPSGNSAICEFTVAVVDREKPQFLRTRLVDRHCKEGEEGVKTGGVCGGWEIKFDEHSKQTRVDSGMTGGAIKEDRMCCNSNSAGTKDACILAKGKNLRTPENSEVKKADAVVKICVRKQLTLEEEQAAFEAP